MNVKKKAVFMCCRDEIDTLFDIFDAVDDLHKGFSGGIDKENDVAVQNECLSRLRGLDGDTVREFTEFVSLIKSGYSVEIKCHSMDDSGFICDRRFIEDD